VVVVVNYGTPKKHLASTGNSKLPSVRALSTRAVKSNFAS
jgi:hypothetical protein